MTMMFFEVSSFSQLENYMDWVEQQHTYPIIFYFNGVCYKLTDKRSKLYFCIGQEAIFNAIGDIIK
jgi:hypothetical protein